MKAYGIRGVLGVLGAQMWVFFWVTWPDEPQCDEGRGTHLAFGVTKIVFAKFSESVWNRPF